jgi:hypothetical protein
MATRLKTTEWWFPAGTTLVDNTDTNLTQITVSLPESSKAFKKVMLEVIVHDRNTTLGSINRHQLSMSVAGSAYTAVNNTNAITNGGEQQTIVISADFTSLFTTSYTGTSHTVDARVLIDSAVASPLSPAFNNVSARLAITYEYDNTSATQIKTVRIPLNAPVGAMGTTKPGTATATIPALDTELPEASKVYRQTVLVLQGNDNNTGTTDQSFTMQIDTNTAYTSDVYEHGSTVSMFVRMNSIQTFDTSSSRSFYVYSSVAMGHHMQAWLVVTYEFDASAANDIYVSLMLPVSMDSPMGGTTSSDYQRATRTLWIQETGIALKQQACYLFWNQNATIAGLNFRIGTGSFVTYTDAAAVLGGSNAAMIRNDSAFSLARGKNTLNVDAYRTDATDLGYNVCGFFIINYTADKPSGGHGAENHTVMWCISDTGTAAVAASFNIAATALAIPESDYFITAFGTEQKFVVSGTSPHAGNAVQVERLSGEGGLIWESVYADLAGADGETGIYHSYSQARDIFQRYPGDTISHEGDRLDPEVSRRWRWAVGNGVTVRGQLCLLITYHAITYTVSGSIAGSSGGTVYIDLVRDGDPIEVLKTTTRVGDGPYSFSWYDNTIEVYTSAYEDSTHVGRSDRAVAT